MSEPNAFGRRLAYLRRSVNLSASELARRAGLARGTLSKLESGGRQPSWRTALKLARALNVGVEMLRAD
jgi:transcriptional regulator with XRE-family HTH domain